ncbi:MAG: efflux RND transporter periplasmic adaptor subunit [Verrucomicrobiales bacterium]
MIRPLLYLLGLVLGPFFGPAALAEESASVLGYLEPYREIEMGFAETGAIDTIFVAEGESVSAGDPLVSLDNGVLEAQLEIAKIQAESDAAILVATAEVEVSKTRFDKLTQLKKSGTAHSTEVARADADHKKAQGQLSIANEEKKIAGFRVEEIEAQIERRILRSPIDGVVLEINREIAETAAAPHARNQDEPLVVVAQIEKLKLVVHVPVGHASLLRMGDTMPIRVLRQSSLSLDREGSATDAVGTIEFVSPAIDPSSETLRTRLVIENQDGNLKSGAHALVVVEGLSED